MNEKLEARWVVVLLAGRGVEATGEWLARLWRNASRRGRVDTALRRLEEAGKIGRVGSGPVDARLYHVTPEGNRALLGPVDAEARWARAWDGRWRFVVFDVPQSRAAIRRRLRRRLKELRCGWLQDSVWVSPDPLDGALQGVRQAKATAESLLVIEGRPSLGESDADVVAGAWDFGRVAKLHAAYLKVAQLRPSSSRKTTASAWMEWLHAEDRAWREVLRHDPFLPATLLPPDYSGRAVWAARAEALHAAGAGLVRALERG